MSESAFNILHRGFDVTVEPGDQKGEFNTVVFENGAQVFQTPVVLDLAEMGDDDLDTYEDELIEEAASAAVDLFEAGRGTLGQGAGVVAMKRKAFVSEWYEDWFMSLKGTSFEDQAASLLEQYFTCTRESGKRNPEIDVLEERMRDIELELDRLNLKRMRVQKANQTIIVVKACLDSATEVQKFLAKFEGTPFQDSAVSLFAEYLDLSKKIDMLYAASENSWERQEEIEDAMTELLITSQQQTVHEMQVEETGLDIAPNMASDLVELMDGVDLQGPLIPMMAKKKVAKKYYVLVGFENGIWEVIFGDYDKDTVVMEKDDNVGGAWEKMKILPLMSDTQKEIDLALDKLNNVGKEARKAFNEDVEHEVQELGNEGGLDPAEVPWEDMPFHTGEPVSLKKEFEFNAWGVEYVLPKGAKGTILNEYDKHGDFYMVEFEDGVHKIPTDFLK